MFLVLLLSEPFCTLEDRPVLHFLVMVNVQDGPTVWAASTAAPIPTATATATQDGPYHPELPHLAMSMRSHSLWAGVVLQAAAVGLGVERRMLIFCWLSALMRNCWGGWMSLMLVRLFRRVGRGRMGSGSWRVRRLLRWWGCLRMWFRGGGIV